MKTNQITHGAMMAALYIILMFVVLYVPLLNMIFFVFLPLPFIVQVCRFGLRATLLVGVVTLVLTPLVAPLYAIMLTVLAVSVGLVMGYFYAQKKGAFLPVLSGMVSYIINFMLLFIISNLLLGLNLLDAFGQMMSESEALSETIADYFQMSAEEEIAALYEDMMYLISNALPAILMLSALMLSTVNHLFSRPILTRLRQDPQTLPPFRRWNMPRSIIFYYMFTLIMLLFNFMEEGSTLHMVVINSHLVLEVMLLIQGLTFIAHYSYFKGWVKFVPIIIVALFFIPFIGPILVMVVRILGILDLGLGWKAKMNQRI